MAFQPITDREDFTSEEWDKCHHAMQVGEMIVEEACVLLKNDGILPLKTNKVNVFGALSAQPYFGGKGSSFSANERAIGFYSALAEAGIAYNPTLYNLMKNWVKNKRVSTAAYPPEKDVYKFKPASVLSTIIDVFSKLYLKEFPASKLSDGILRDAVNYSETAITIASDGPAGVHDSVTARAGISYPSGTTVASTWNPDLIYSTAPRLDWE